MSSVPPPPPGMPPPPPNMPPPPMGGPAFGAAPSMGAPLAEWPQRALAGLIDWFGPSLVASILGRSSVGLNALLSLAALAWTLYNAYLNGSTGQSTGKKIVGLKMVDANTGQLVGGGKGVIRAFAHFVDAIICYVGFLFPLWDSKKQTLADKIMSTVVLNVGK